jgi:excisionase family DNA binding protein
MEDMEELAMKKINSSALEYPVVLRKVLNDLVISVPDLGYWKTLALNPKKPPAESSKTSTRNEMIDLEDLFLNDILEALKDAWIEIDSHKTNKKWVPSPSTFKQSVQKSESDFTLPEFAKELSKHMSISENTIRREIARGVIQCYQTEGGHRRIPFSELALYLAERKTSKRLLEL